MGTTRIKVIDLSSDKKEIKTSRKHAEKLAGPAKIKDQQKEEKPKEAKIEGQPEAAETPKEEKLSKKQTKSRESTTAHHKGSQYLVARHKIEEGKTYPLPEALELLKDISYTKFDPTVEAHLNVIEKNMKGSINFPHQIGKQKEKRYLIFTDQKPSTNYQQPIIWADEKTIEEISSGKLKPQKDFDLVIATPKYMPQLAKIAKVLGPKGMMPNPKNGTIVDNVEKALATGDNALYEYKSDPTAPIIHTKIGKLSFGKDDLKENFLALVNSVGPSKIKKATIATTMSPGIKVDVATL